MSKYYVVGSGGIVVFAQGDNLKTVRQKARALANKHDKIFTIRDINLNVLSTIRPKVENQRNGFGIFGS